MSISRRHTDPENLYARREAEARDERIASRMLLAFAAVAFAGVLIAAQGSSTAFKEWRSAAYVALDEPHGLP
jgi:hypothetical protein